MTKSHLNTASDGEVTSCDIYLYCECGSVQRGSRLIQVGESAVSEALTIGANAHVRRRPGIVPGKTPKPI